MDSRDKECKIQIENWVLLVLLVSCTSVETVWVESPPEAFQGRYIQVSDEIIQGYAKPIIIELTKSEFRYSSQEVSFDLNTVDPKFKERVTNTYPIRTVSITRNRIVIFCGDKNEDHIAEFRFALEFDSDNFLFVDEVVSTGIDDEIALFPVGRFTSNNYYNDSK